MGAKSRVPLWLPYLQKAEKARGDEVKFIYNGGEVTIKPEELLSVMLYGDAAPIPTEIIELLARKHVPIVIHRRNMATTVWVHSGPRSDKNDIITKQILFRQNQIKRKYITRRLLEEKLKALDWLIRVPQNVLNKRMTIEEMRNMEAILARRYWREYYKMLGREGSRRSEGDVKFVLDGISKFTSGILLRWICYHHLSPFHGYCHQPTDYPSLVYDLLEPYRPGIEKMVFESMQLGTGLKQDQLLAYTINRTKEYLDEEVFVGATRQIVTRHELYHGVVLSLRSYLIGNSRKFIVPVASKPNGGRPVKVDFKMYGRSAGKTDFWRVAKKTANKQRV